MDTYQIGILEPNNFSEEALERLQGLGNVECFAGGDPGAFAREKDILFVRLKYYLGPDLLDKSPHLKIICSPTTGLNHIDLPYMEKRGIKLISLRNEREFLQTIRATPEHIFGLTLALLRNYYTAFLSPVNKGWDRDRCRGSELYENSVGIIGMGRIGKIMAGYFLSFGARVYFYDTDASVEAPAGVQKTESLQYLLNQARIILLCASYNQGDDMIFGENFINQLQNKFFINAARGELLDEEYLLTKIESGHFAGIALDVIANETQPCNNLEKFLTLTVGRNFIITPHTGGATFESMRRTEEFITGRLFEWFNKIHD